MANFLQEKKTRIRCPVQRTRPHVSISQAFHQFISVGRKFPKFSEPSQTGRVADSPEVKTTHLAAGCAASTGSQQAHWELLDLQTAQAPDQDGLRGFKPVMPNFLGPESLSLQLVAKL